MVEPGLSPTITTPLTCNLRFKTGFEAKSVELIPPIPTEPVSYETINLSCPAYKFALPSIFRPVRGLAVEPLCMLIVSVVSKFDNV